ncbi:MAG: hypothetical protein ACKPKO_33330, partial [Candidatus Fonsibacter sp.]
MFRERDPITRQIAQEPSSICPFCHESKKQEGDIYYAEIEACYNKLREIDDYLVSKEIRVQLFGEKHADR